MPLRRSRIDRTLADLLEESGRNVVRASVLLRDLFADHPEGAGLVEELRACEREGDRIAREIHRWLAAGRRVRAPFDRAEGQALARALDDVVDHAEEAGSELLLYGVEAPIQQTVDLTEVLVRAAGELGGALRCLRARTDPTPQLEAIDRLEAEGDRIERDALASLFAGGIDPVVIIRWKDILASLEAAIDGCQRVGHILEGIALRSGLA